MQLTRLTTALLSGCTIAMAATFPAYSADRSKAGSVYIGQVYKIVDGDTFDMHRAPYRIRVHGINAPERRQRGGAPATAFLKSKILGFPVKCVETNRHRYWKTKRIAAKCSVNGKDIAMLLLCAGHAKRAAKWDRKGEYRKCVR